MSLRKAREKQNKQDDSQPEATKRVSSASKDVSKRELIRQGEYVQLAALVPKDLVKRLKHLVIDGDDGMDISDHVAAALTSYLDDVADK
jgi:hypothetical protein